MTAYWVQVSKALLKDKPAWESIGLTMTAIIDGPDDPVWCKFEDPAAPEEFEGRQVELTLDSHYEAADPEKGWWSSRMCYGVNTYVSDEIHGAAGVLFRKIREKAGG